MRSIHLQVQMPMPFHQNPELLFYPSLRICQRLTFHLWTAFFRLRSLYVNSFSHFLLLSRPPFLLYLSTKYACIILISDIISHLEMTSQLESDSRRMQVIRLRGSVSATSCPSHWGVIYCSWKTRLIVNTSFGMSPLILSQILLVFLSI